MSRSLTEQLLCHEYNTGTTGVSVYCAAKHIWHCFFQLFSSCSEHLQSDFMHHAAQAVFPAHRNKKELVTLLRSWGCSAPLSESLWLLLLVRLLKVFHRHGQKTIVVLFCGHIFMLDSFYVFPHKQNPPCVTSAECLLCEQAAVGNAEFSARPRVNERILVKCSF